MLADCEVDNALTIGQKACAKRLVRCDFGHRVGLQVVNADAKRAPRVGNQRAA